MTVFKENSVVGNDFNEHLPKIFEPVQKNWVASILITGVSLLPGEKFNSHVNMNFICSLESAVESFG